MGPKGGRFDPGGSRHAGERRRPARSEAHEGIGARLGGWTARPARRGKQSPRAQGSGTHGPGQRWTGLRRRVREQRTARTRSKLGKAQGGARARKQAQGARRRQAKPKRGRARQQGSKCGPRHAQVGPRGEESSSAKEIPRGDLAYLPSLILDSCNIPLRG